MPLATAEQYQETIPATSIGHDIDYLFNLREKKRKLEEQVKEMSSHMTEVERRLMDRMHNEGISRASGSKATITLQQITRPHVEDWELVYEFIRKSRMFHLFERRLSTAAWNELTEKRGGKPMPGTKPFVQETLSLRVIS